MTKQEFVDLYQTMHDATRLAVIRTVLQGMLEDMYRIKESGKPRTMLLDRVPKSDDRNIVCD